MKTVIIDYGAGNSKSVQFACQRLGINALLTNDQETIMAADKIIFPGVGHASYAMQQLKANRLDRFITELKQPVLGICLGMQLLCKQTEEDQTPGLGIFDVKVKKFPNTVKVPQIGWNQLEQLKSPLFDKVNPGDYMYLVHSYYVPECTEQIATVDCGFSYAAALQSANFYGVQFHPEKSSKAGAQVLANFLSL